MLLLHAAVKLTSGAVVARVHGPMCDIDGLFTDHSNDLPATDIEVDARCFSLRDPYRTKLASPAVFRERSSWLLGVGVMRRV